MDKMEIKHLNEKYLLEVKQEIESIEFDLRHNVKTWSTVDMESNAFKWIKAIQKREVLYFTFGKYKGRIVQDVFNQDSKYIDWFIKNVQGKDLNTLKIIDYLIKTSCKRHYYFIAFFTALKDFEEKFIPVDKADRFKDHVKQFIIRKYEYETGSNIPSYNDYSFNIGYEDSPTSYYGDECLCMEDTY